MNGTTPRISLRGLIGKQKDAAPVVAGLLEKLAGPIGIEDVDGRLLAGERTDAPVVRLAVTLDGTTLGWVAGPPGAEAVAALLGHLAAKEAEKKSLGSEVLHLYREVNLIYNFSEKLAALLDLDAVARMTLDQARQLITATDGALTLLDPETGLFETVATFGRGTPCAGGIRWGEGIVGEIAARGVAEIVNDVRADPRCGGESARMSSLICASLKVGERVTGAIALASVEMVTYTAGDLKLLSTLALQTATAIENARLYERTVQAARERERLAALHKELEVAASIQANLFPSELPAIPGYDLAVRNRPARQCGGDYYDVLVTSDGGAGDRVLLCVADVSGKGLPASLLMANTQATLRALAGQAPSLVDLASKASDLLYANTSANKYVTATLVELSPESGAARYLSAGHTNCLLLRADGQIEWLESTGTPLGLLPPGLPCGDSGLRIEPGDCLALFSDGVPEAKNDRDEEFGEDQVAAIVRASAGQPAEATVARIVEAIDAFAGSAPQFDDITLLVLKRQG